MMIDPIVLSTRKFLRQRDYWMDHLRNYEADPVLESNSLEMGGEGREKRVITLNREDTERLRQVSQGSDLALHCILVGILQAAIYRLTGKRDISVGTPVLKAEKSYAYNDQVVIRSRIGLSDSFKDLLYQVRDRVDHAFENQDYPFERIMEALQLDPHHGAYDVMFRLDQIQDDVESPFKVTCTTEKKGVELIFDYDSKRYGQQTLTGLITYFRRMLRQCLRHPDLPLSEHEVLSDSEWKEILDRFNETEVPYPRQTISALFEEQVRKSPDRVALIFKEQKLTYLELNMQANRLAHAIQRHGIQPGMHVGICMERSLDLVIGLLAILKAGCAYVPLDPNYPKKRLHHMMKDAHIRVLLTQGKMAEAPSEDVHVIRVDEQQDEIKGCSSDNPEVLQDVEDLAYINYTSGSTGNPKGVSVTHQGVVRLVKGRSCVSCEHETFLHFCSISFDVSAFEIWGSLLNGSTLVVYPFTQPELDRLGSVIQKYGVTTLWLTSGVFHQMVDHHLEDLRGVNQLLTGGDVVSPSHVKKTLEQLDNIKVINGYGPTEATIFSSFYEITVGRQVGTIVSIGRPAPNTWIYILDPCGKPVPVGVPGEMYISGPGVAKGYWNSRELTTETFLPDPFSNEKGVRMYKTGDLARWLPDGNIEFLGRRDHQVKIRGIRIETAEIEAVLKEHPLVKDGLVMAASLQTGEKQLVAYCVLRNTTKDVSSIREFLRQKLPDAMIPVHFIPLDRFPLTPNGKVDRRSLPDPAEGRHYREYVPPGTFHEKEMVRLWSEVLQIPRIGIHDNFFEVGGNSINAVVLISKLFKRFDVKISLQALSQHPTIQTLLHYIKKSEKELYSPIQPAEKKRYYPTSSAQKRIYILQKMGENNTNYNMPEALLIEGELDPGKLKDIFGNLVRRHESFRTSFHMVEDEIVQQIHPQADFEMEFEQVEESYIPEVISRYVKPFDLETAPLIRVKLVQCARNRHYLLIDMHHIISDGFSMGILVQEMSTLYAGGSLPDLTIQYKDFTQWQIESFKGEQYKRQEDYWLTTFKDGVPVLETPTDKPRPSVMNHEGERILFRLDHEMTQRVRQFAADLQATPFIVLLAVYKVLLSKWTNQEDLVVAYPVVGRPHPDLEQLVGMFVNTVAMRSQPKGKWSFSEFASKVKDYSMNIFDNQDYQFEMLVEKLKIERDPSRNPLFDTMFSLRDATLSGLELSGLKISRAELPVQNIKFDYYVNVEEGEDVTEFELCYRSDLFLKGTMESFCNSYLHLIATLLDRPNVPLSEVGLLSPDEERQMILQSSQTAVDYPGHLSLSQLFAEQVRNNPDQPAVAYNHRQITYQQLDKLANRLAYQLRKQGLGPNQVAAVMMERSIELIIGILAVIKAGATYMPIDVDIPRTRKNFMLRDSHAQMLLTQKDQMTGLEFTGSYYYLDGILEKDISCDSTGCIYYDNQPQDLAYIIYTSGSTGNPKGTMVEHRNVVRLVKNTNYIDFGKCRRILQTGSVVFDASTFEIWGSLLNGLTLQLVDKEDVIDPTRLEHVLKQYKIDTLFLTSPLFTQLSDHDPSLFRTVKNLLVGGDVLSAKQMNQVRQNSKVPNLVHVYGPTENTTFSTSYRVARDFEGNIPIGKPIHNSTAYIFDLNGNHIQPVGVPGELYVGGEGVARGYLNVPELTSRKFVYHPLIPGERLYRTGDLARWLPDGNLEFLGRLDHQVKIRGYRLELNEVENVLFRHPCIQETVVVDLQDDSGQKYLCAYYVADQELSQTELRTFLEDILPEYMVPSCFVAMKQLPLNLNGKVDRKALPKVDVSRRSTKEHVPPRNKTEKKMARIWAEVLGVERVGISDNFFDLGGHSLKATELKAKISRTFGMDFPLKAIFKSPTIEKLLQQIQFAEKPVPTVRKLEPREYYPASAAQKRLYTLWHLDPGETLYNMPDVRRIEGKVDRKRLEFAFAELIRRHESLRTSFELVEGDLVQKIHPKVDFEVICLQVSQEKLEQTFRDFIRPFDLSRGPLLRVALVESASECYLVMDMHHIISDGTSMGILAREFAELYQGKELPSLNLQYKEFAVWQNSLAESEEMKKQEQYWLKVFGDEVPVLELAADASRPQAANYHGGTYRFKLDGKWTEMLRKEARKQGATLFMILLASYHVLLSRWSGSEDIVIGTPVAGRRHADLEGIVGMFVNTLALRNRSEGYRSFTEFLQSVRENTLEAFDNQDYQFDTLVERLNLHRDLSRHPLFDALFALQNVEKAEVNTGEFVFRRQDFPYEVCRVDLELSIEEHDKGLWMIFRYRKALFHDQTIMRIGMDFVNILKAVASGKEPQIPSITTQGEMQVEKMEEQEKLDSLLDELSEDVVDQWLQELLPEKEERK